MVRFFWSWVYYGTERVVYQWLQGIRICRKTMWNSKAVNVTMNSLLVKILSDLHYFLNALHTILSSREHALHMRSWGKSCKTYFIRGFVFLLYFEIKCWNPKYICNFYFMRNRKQSSIKILISWVNYTSFLASVVFALFRHCNTIVFYAFLTPNALIYCLFNCIHSYF